MERSTLAYGLVAHLVFWVLIIRTGILYGRKIPLIFIGLWFAGLITLPRALPFGFSLFVCGLGIVLAVIDRIKSTPWNQM